VDNLLGLAYIKDLTLGAQKNEILRIYQEFIGPQIVDLLNFYGRDAGKVGGLLQQIDVDNVIRHINGQIYIAAQVGDLPKIIKYGESLLSNNVNALFQINPAGNFSPLISAASNGHLAVVQKLVDLGGDINFSGRADHATALHLACQNGHLKVVEYLVERPEFVSQVRSHVNNQETNNLLTTVLHDACTNGHHEIAKLLLNKGADGQQFLEWMTNDTDFANSAHRDEVLHVLRDHYKQPAAGTARRDNTQFANAPFVPDSRSPGS
jgi:ankyrin repeat protein